MPAFREERLLNCGTGYPGNSEFFQKGFKSGHEANCVGQGPLKHTSILACLPGLPTLNLSFTEADAWPNPSQGCNRSTDEQGPGPLDQ